MGAFPQYNDKKGAKKPPAKERRHRYPLGVHLLMLVSTGLVSTSFLVGKAITNALDPALLTGIRFCIATLLFAPIVHFRYGLRFSLSIVVRCAMVSGSIVGFFYCMFLSLRYTTALHTSAIFALVPSLTGLYSFVLLGEQLTRAQLMALFCGLFGALWVIFDGDLAVALAVQWNSGDLIFFAGCCCMGLYAPLIKLTQRDEPMAVMTFWILCTGCIWLLFLANSQITATSWSTIPARVWAGVFYLAVFTTIITFFLTQYAVFVIGPTKVTAYSYLYPSLVLFIDLLLGRSHIPLQVVPGILIILTAMFILMGIPEKTA